MVCQLSVLKSLSLQSQNNRCSLNTLLIQFSGYIVATKMEFWLESYLSDTVGTTQIF